MTQQERLVQEQPVEATTSSRRLTDHWVPKPNPNLEYYKRAHKTVVWGQYYVRKTVEKGTFVCPACDKQQTYKHKLLALKRHVCWIPVPAAAAQDKGDYVKCCACHVHFRPSVLHDDPLLVGSKKLLLLDGGDIGTKPTPTIAQQQAQDDTHHTETEAN